MRLFNAQLLDEHLEGGGAFTEPPWAWACFLARAEALKFFCVTDQVTGSPTLNVDLLGGNAGDPDEMTKQALINKVLAAGTTVITATYSSQDAKFPPPRHLFIVASIAGAGTKAHVQLWVCGRGPQLLEAIPPASASFASQYAAARVLADEDRLPLKKVVLRAGASVFYPPELFLPSLKWER